MQYKPEYHMVLYRSYAELEHNWKYMTICCINFDPCRSITKQIWPCHNKSQGQDSVIIWTNLVVPRYLMLYTKFQGHQPLAELWRFFTKYGPGNHLGHSNIPWRLNMKFGFNRPSVLVFLFWEKKFENVETEWPWTKANDLDLWYS